MSRQFGRICRVTVEGKGGKAVFVGDQAPDPGLQISFSTTKTLGSKQNSGTVTITNLSKARRNQLGDEFDKLTLEVGYKDAGYSVILKGDIRDVTHAKTSPDVETTIEVGDGDKAVQTGSVSKTFPSGTKPKEIVEYLAKKLPGVEVGQIKGLDDLPKTKRPTTVYGRTYRELDEQGRQHGFYWSMQNGKFQALKNDESLGGSILISAETGMIGVAEPTDKGVKVKCLLNPAIEPGKTIKVKSGFLDESSGRDKRDSDDGGGEFRVASVSLQGSTRAEDWYCDVEANRIQQGKVKK